MRVFMSGASFRAEYGGPAVSVPRLASALAAHGVSVTLWAADGSRPQSAAVDGHGAVTFREGPLLEALRQDGRPEIIHDNGIWLRHNHAIAVAAREMGIPRVVTPRGMLEPWSLAHRFLKKRVAWLLYQKRDLNSADILHCTAKSEARNVARLHLRPKCVIAPNGVDMPQDLAQGDLGPAAQASGRVRRMLFMSRVHPKKGLPMLLEAWSQLGLPGWMLQIAGPTEGNHETEIRAFVQRLGLSDVVDFLGPVYGDQKADLLRAADVFVLPTHSENFGMVVAEALSYRTPVLTTTGAPWESLVTDRCGWWVEPTVAGLCEGLAAATAASDAQREEMGARGRGVVAERFGWDRIAADVHDKIYLPLLSGSGAKH